MSIDPRMWDDESFVGLSDLEQGLWVFLLAGPVTVGGVPGLIVGGPAAFAEGMRRDVGKVRAALAKLVAVGLVQHDEERRLVRIANAPKYCKPGNGNVVTGWFRRWRVLPESPLKYEHVESLRPWASKYEAAWSESFGSVDLGKVFRNRFESHGGTVSKETRSGTGSGTLTGTETGSETGSGSGGVVANAGPAPVAAVRALTTSTPRGGRKSPTETERALLVAKHREAADRLWFLQGELRRASIPGARVLALDDDARYRIALLLERGGMSEDDVAHVLHVYAAEACARPESRQWFDGVSNFRPENAKRALGKTVAGVTGSQPALPGVSGGGYRRGLTATEVMQAAERMAAEEAKRNGGE